MLERTALANTHTKAILNRNLILCLDILSCSELRLPMLDLFTDHGSHSCLEGLIRIPHPNNRYKIRFREVIYQKQTKKVNLLSKLIGCAQSNRQEYSKLAYIHKCVILFMEVFTMKSCDTPVMSFQKDYPPPKVPADRLSLQHVSYLSAGSHRVKMLQAGSRATTGVSVLSTPELGQCYMAT